MGISRRVVFPKYGWFASTALSDWRTFGVLGLMLWPILGAACGPNEAAIEPTVTVAATVAAISNTPQPALTRQAGPTVAIDLLKTRWNSSVFVVTNRAAKRVTLSFDFKAYDADKSYLFGETFDLLQQSRPYDKFVPPNSTVGFECCNVPWDSVVISNIRIRELSNSFPGQQSGAPPCTIHAYDKMVMVEPPVMNLLDQNPRIFGEVRNVGDSTPESMIFKGVFRNNGQVVEIFKDRNKMSPAPVPPPGEKVKFMLELPPQMQGLPPLPDAYDSFDVTIISWSGC